MSTIGTGRRVSSKYFSRKSQGLKADSIQQSISSWHAVRATKGRLLMPSFTKGPWQFVNAWGPLEFDGRHRFLKCVGADYQTVLCTNDRSVDIQARQEDMRLIAASPKLLEALKQVVASA